MPPGNAALETPRSREEIRAAPSGGVTSRGTIEKGERRISAGEAAGLDRFAEAVIMELGKTFD
jgi:hypothetical protein